MEENQEEVKQPCEHQELVYSKEFKTVRCEQCQRVWRDEWERPINLIMQAPPQFGGNLPIIGGPRSLS